MHWCNDETQALLASIPVLGAAWLWVRVKGRALWNRIRGKNDCGCGHDH